MTANTTRPERASAVAPLAARATVSAMQSNSLEHPAQGIGEVDFPRASSASDYGKLISEDAEK